MGAEEILESLRVDADQKFFNHFDWVWTKKIKGGITDCCFTDDPCEWHAAMEKINTLGVGNA